MKKTICIIITIIICFVNCGSTIAQNNNPLNLEQEQIDEIMTNSINCAIDNLEKHDIVRDAKQKWNKGDPITRRNAAEIAYIVKMEGIRFINMEADYIEYLQEQDVDKMHMASGVMPADVEYLSYDYYLADHVRMFNLLEGVSKHDKIYMEFDRNLTYNEAIIIVSRLLINRESAMYEKNIICQDMYDDENAYMRFLTQVGLINSNSVVNYSTLTIDETMLDKEISAYEYMLLVNSALYIRHFANPGDYGGGTPMYRTIHGIYNGHWKSIYQPTGNEQIDIFIP